MRFRRLHARVLASCLLAFTPAAGAGCASPIGEFETTACLAGAPELTADADFVALRVRPDAEHARQVFSWGEACGTATDRPACQAKLDTLAFGPSLATQAEGMYLADYDVIITKGDDVVQISNAGSLVSVLGSVDTPAEALLVALAHGDFVPCDRQNVREDGSSYVLLAQDDSSCDAEDYEVTVDAGGRVTEGEREQVSSGDCSDEDD